jgi:hypothetical protein
MIKQETAVIVRKGWMLPHLLKSPESYQPEKETASTPLIVVVNSAFLYVEYGLTVPSRNRADTLTT